VRPNPRCAPRRAASSAVTAITAVAVLAGAALLAFAPPAAAGTAGQVTVKPGDTLSGIAVKLGVSTSALAATNGIDNRDRIVAGSVLKVPSGSGATSTGTRYTVRPGDTVTSIAGRYHTTIAALVAANGLRDPHLIVIGSTLVIPAGGSSSATGAGSSSTGLPSRLLASPSRLALRDNFAHWANYYGTPTALLEGLTWLESGWQNGVVSSTDAVGIGQLMPDTVDLTANVLIKASLDPNVPDDNIRMSSRYLRYLLDRTGSTSMAIAAYYQGYASIQRSGMYESTKTYVADVLALRDRFAANP
jgi:LysM repeat protein